MIRLAVILISAQTLDIWKLDSVQFVGDKQKKPKKSRTRRSLKVATSTRRAPDRESDTDDKGSDADSKSLKYELVPAWCKPEIKTEIVPTIIEIFGAQDNPWTLKTVTHGPLVDILQKRIDDVFPERHHTVQRKEILYRWVSTYECGLDEQFT